MDTKFDEHNEEVINQSQITIDDRDLFEDLKPFSLQSATVTEKTQGKAFVENF